MFHYARLVITQLALLAIIVMILGSTAGSPRVLVQALTLTAAVSVSLTFFQSIMSIVGSGLCAFTPNTYRARVLILGALLCDGLALVLGVIMVTLKFPPVFLGLFGLISWFLFLFFMRALALEIDHPGSENDAGGLVTMGLLILVAAPLAGVLIIGVLGLAGAFIGIGPESILFLAGLAAFVWLFFSIRYTFAVIELVGSMRALLLPQPQEIDPPVDRPRNRRPSEQD